MTDFDQLPVPRQKALITQLAEQALVNWGLENAQLTLLKHRENSVFKVERPEGDPRVLRVHRLDYHSDRQQCEAVRHHGIETRF